MASQLAAHGLHLLNASADARKTCELDRGYAGQKPASVLRYEVSSLARLPDDIEQKLASGRYHQAAVGACQSGGSAEFARFRIAILLY